MSERIPLDAYYTPDVLAEQLVGLLVAHHDLDATHRVEEPHAGGGAFVRALSPHVAMVLARDINPLAPGLHDVPGYRASVWEYLASDASPIVEWVVGNPPYSHALEHIVHALSRATVGVAYLLRASILASRRRASLWGAYPPAAVYQLVQRPSFTGGGTDSSDYVWVVWEHAHEGEPVLRWLDWRSP